jgi:DNA-binding SARP family transcriptional activator
MAGETEFCLLGPLTVRVHGAQVPVPPGQQRMLLAALLLQAGQAVSTDELTEVLWGAVRPSAPKVSLQSCVMRLRKSLGASASAIVTEPGGYLIRIGADDLDISRFEAALAAGRAAARAGSWAAAAGQLAGGLALWRGQPLAGVGCEALELRERPRLAELRLQALEARIDADLHLGRHAEVLAELRSLTAGEPLRERLRGLLMIALYRDGQRTAALTAYQAAREVLIDELGAEPGPELQRLHERVRDGDPALAIAGPAVPATAGAGGVAVRYSLPPDTVAFTGRDGELDQIGAALADAVTGAAGPDGIAAAGIRVIGGMPGIGKTALALHAAHRLRASFPDRQLFVDLRGHTSGQQPLAPAAALAGLLAAAGVDPRSMPAGLDGRSALWRDRMSHQRALLVLDNAASSAQVAPLLPGGDRCLVLVTSRRHLADLPGAVVPVLLDVLPPGRARQMFTALAPRAAADPPWAVAELVALAGFLPLALSLLARLYNRHPSWSLADLTAETRASLPTLTAEQDSVAAAFEVSWLHLAPAQQDFFQRLSRHPGTAVDAAAAAALAGIPPAQARALLDDLHGEGLLTETGYRQYGMHDLIRRYLADRAAGEAGAVAAGHLPTVRSAGDPPGPPVTPAGLPAAAERTGPDECA